MKISNEVNKTEQINKIFSQFSEENKDHLLNIAEGLLKVQEETIALFKGSQKKDEQ